MLTVTSCRISNGEHDAAKILEIIDFTSKCEKKASLCNLIKKTDISFFCECRCMRDNIEEMSRMAYQDIGSYECHHKVEK